MANTSSRTLRLLSLLQSHRFWPGGELADRLAVSVRTLRRDVDRLRDLGYPVDARRGVDGGYQLAAGAALPPLVVDDEEAVALAVSLLSAAQHPSAGTAEAAVRALAKVVQVMPKTLRRKVEAVRTATDQGPLAAAAAVVDAGLLTTLAQSCRDTERARFSYAAADGAVTDRLVEPLRLVPFRQRWYLVAYDTGRADWRSFRLDRITGVAGTGVRFAPRRLPAADAATFLRDRLSGLARPLVVVALAEAPAERVRERIGWWAEIEPAGDRRCQVRVNAESLDWAAMALGVMGCEFMVLEPPEAVTHLRGWAERFTRASAGTAVADAT